MVYGMHHRLVVPLLVILDELRVFLLEHVPRHLLGYVVDESVAFPVEPVHELAVEPVDSVVDPSVEKLVLHEVDGLLHLAFRGWVWSSAEVYAEIRLPYEILEFLHEDDIAEVLGYHHRLVMVVDYHLRPSYEVPERIDVAFYGLLRVERLSREIGELHPAVGQHHREEIYPYVPPVHRLH